VTTVRLDSATSAALDRLARRRGQTRSEVLRDAIGCLAGDEEENAPSAFDRLRPFVGIADSGGRQLSRESAARFVRGRGPNRD
jgi:Ribbon-helix-helix protein, copG family